METAFLICTLSCIALFFAILLVLYSNVVNKEARKLYNNAIELVEIMQKKLEHERALRYECQSRLGRANSQIKRLNAKINGTPKTNR